MDRTSPAYCVLVKKREELVLADIKIHSDNIGPSAKAEIKEIEKRIYKPQV